ncbi:anti-CBASS protein Acb1 family protein [Aureimonas ureilytica]|uniref:anti-CBASS protein Acb1 family protein n=1 Tax=Aureimonas ureilytica TaxID=401562 RepID=UPI000378D809|nr:anti-CBASS Acb1 family protein [Aureimonas ureilytica]
MLRVFDTLANLITGMGTAKAKSSASVYAFMPTTHAELEAAYRGSWLARKVVDVPAMDMCREWRSWQADDAQIEAIEAEEARLGLQGKVLEAKIKARLYGGAVIVIGDGTIDQASELQPERIRKGGVLYLVVLTASRVSAGEIETDVASKWFGTPAYYEITTNTATRVRIHPSRVARFVGAPVPDEATSGRQGWGDSILEAVSKALKDAESAAANIAEMTHEAKIDIIRIPGLMQMASDADYEARFQRRTSLAMLAKSLNNTLILDKEEEYEQKQVSFGALPDVLDRFLQIAAGAADIPMTRLLGQSPAGMNSTGESDLINYYDRIGAGQKLELGPSLAHIDECLIWSALGNRPPEIHYRWNPLWQMSEKDRAEVGLKKAQSFQIDASSGLLPDSALSKARVNQLVEDGQYPGLEAAMDEAQDEGDAIDFGAKAEEPEPAPISNVIPARMAANDATPRPLYVHRKVKNGAEIIAWAKRQGFTSTLEATDLHVTIAFSRAPVDWMAVGESWESEIKIAAGGPRVMEQFGDATVLLISSSSLKWRHEEMKEAGASWDHDSYQPHITISYGGAPADLSAVTPYQGEIVLGPEVFEPLDDDWKAKVTGD